MAKRYTKKLMRGEEWKRVKRLSRHFDETLDRYHYSGQFKIIACRKYYFIHNYTNKRVGHTHFWFKIIFVGSYALRIGIEDVTLITNENYSTLQHYAKMDINKDLKRGIKEDIEQFLNVLATKTKYFKTVIVWS